MPRVTLDGIDIHDGDTVQLMGTLTIDTLGQNVTLFVDGYQWTPVSTEGSTLSFAVAQGGLFDVRVNGRGTLRFTNTFDPEAFRVESVDPAFSPAASASRPVQFTLLGLNLDKYGDDLDFRFSPNNDNPLLPSSGWSWHNLSEATDVAVEAEEMQLTYSLKLQCYLSAIRVASTEEIIWTNNTRPLPEI